MKISELIEKLQHQRNLYGDLVVYHKCADDCYGSIMEQVEGVRALEHDTIGKPPEGVELI